MKLQRIVQFSFGNLWRRKLRSILTLWGMSVGIGAMVLLISFAAGLQAEARKSFLSSISLTELNVMKQRLSDMFSGAGPQELQTFTEDDLKKLRELPHVRTAYIPIVLPGMKLQFKGVSLDIYAEAMPVERISDQRRQDLEAGTWWNSNDEAAIVLSNATVEKLKVSAKDIVGQEVVLKTVSFSQSGPKLSDKEYKMKVVGVVKKSDGGFMGGPFGQEFLSEATAKPISDEFSKELGGEPMQLQSSNVTVIVDASENVTSVRQEIEKLGWFAQGAEDILKGIDQGFLVMKVVLGIIGGIALFVALIGITNSMLMAVLERTREIGILKSLGASRRTISSLFLTEAAWLGVIGALAGIGGAYLIGKGIISGFKAYVSISNKDSSAFPPLAFSISWELFLGTLIGAVLITLFAGWLPASRAAKQDPVKALRHE